ncbi:cbb3-type cytochrome c oxidase subunit 3 [Erythrobacter sp. SCSIO 43205]|uniref:cbb3-type cytochrome oxidase subunit 3 n=1 Tax=Erythrobacter sp. SCSIO 43205 TaxID=2779361 RepID=UPI001CA7C82C|nr:cbb3-type cytochrome c oxidase subunit 3 [Erythrobacter sp. SCSIO 43205]UAB78902.1 cbb3-type cytochrome c oxidase subunit 3 [Erythrobacter sp. SCSIO 43205]
MSFYETLRHLADSYGLVMIFALYVLLCGWSFLPHSKARVEEAKNSIFEEDENV